MVDSDDMLTPDELDKLMKEIEETRLEMGQVAACQELASTHVVQVSQRLDVLLLKLQKAKQLMKTQKQSRSRHDK